MTSLKAKYVVEEDRMQLQLHQIDHLPYVYLLTRKQWLTMLYRLHLIAEKFNIELTIPTLAKLPRNKVFADSANNAVQPVKLDNVHIRMEGNDVRLIFVAGEEKRSVKLKTPGIKKFEELLMAQAERADWDPQAALDRLRAGQLARKVTQRAQKM